MNFEGFIMPLPIPLIDPLTKKLTPTARKQLREILQAQYLSRFIKFPPQVFPVPPRPNPADVFDGDPDPQPSIPLENLLQKSLLGELLIHALGDPMPVPSRVSIVNEIKKEKLEVEVVSELIRELEGGIKSLKKELESLK